LSVVQQPSSAGLVARVTGMLKSPATEWDVIDGEAATVQGLFTGYVVILALIPAVSAILAGLVQSTFHLGFGFAHVLMLPLIIAMAVVSYAAQLVSVFILGFLADALAPSFDGQKSQSQAFKLAAYSPTASWVCSVFQIIPFIGWIGALAGGIYSLYTFWIGAPKLMKVPADKAIGFNIVLILAWLIIYWLILAVVGGMVTAMFIGSAIAAGGLVH
jgi:hypothetical protein